MLHKRSANYKRPTHIPGRRSANIAQSIALLPERERTVLQERMLALYHNGECIGCNHQGVPLSVKGAEMPLVYEGNGFAAPAEYCDCELGTRYRRRIEREREEHRRQSRLDDYHYACKLFEPCLLKPPTRRTYTLDSWPLHFSSTLSRTDEQYKAAYNKRVFLQKTVKDVVEDIQRGNEPYNTGICLQGYAGVGKTGLFLSMASALAEIDHYVLSLYTPTLFTFFQASDQQEKMLRTLRRIPFLFLDNLGDPQSLDPAPYYIRRFLGDILDARFSARLYTMVTTELDNEELEYQFGDAIVSRMGGLCVMLEVPGVDLR